MSLGQQIVETLVCYCYDVTESQIRDSIDLSESPTIEQIALRTRAGTGCTACHCRLQRMLAGLPPTCGADDTCATCGFATALCDCTVG